MGQHLQRVESRVDNEFCSGHFSLDSVGKAEKQRVATGEDDDGRGRSNLLLRKNCFSFLVLLEHCIEWCRDVYPFRPFWQQMGYELVMAFASRENLPLFYDSDNLRIQLRLSFI